MLTSQFGPRPYAVYTDFYSAVSIISVLLTHGMETTFFRYFQKFKDDEKRQNTAYFTALTSVFIVSVVFLFFGIMARKPLATAFKHPDEVNFLVWFLFILAFDAMCAVPFARLRIQTKALSYASLKILNSALIFIFTVLFIFGIPWLKNHAGIVEGIFHKFPDYGIGYAFVANLIASIATFLALLPVMAKGKYSFDFDLWEEMLDYAWPITIAGLAGVINESMDRQFIKYLMPGKIAEDLGIHNLSHEYITTLSENITKEQLGIYGAAYKIVVFIALFKTAYLLGVEPFFFSHAGEKNSGKTYANLMKYFSIFSAFILLILVANLDWLGKIYISNPQYWSGFKVVPLLLISTTFLGIYLNLSIWYKLSDNTRYGAVISGIGAIITIVINYAGLKYTNFGYWACAWATFLSYFAMMVISYFWGQNKYPIPYNHRKLLFYIGGSAALSAVSYYGFSSPTMRIVVGNIFFLIFLYLTLKIEHQDVKIFKEKIKNFRIRK